MRATRPLIAVAAAALLISACGSSGSKTADPAALTTTVPAPRSVTTPPVDDVVAVTPITLQPVDGLIATAPGELPVYASVGDATPASTLPAHTEFGSPTTLLVRGWGDGGNWLEVMLPVRPNGSTGFIRSADIELTRAEYAIDVDLATRMLRVHGPDDSVVVDTAIAIGSPENPTPTGEFFVTDLLDTGDDFSAYGPFALGISAFSLTLSEFAGGDGQIGIHGTNQASSIGNAVSHGCVRVPNDVISQLAQLLPLGTPVTIR